MRSRLVLDASAALHLVMDGKNSDAIAERIEEARLVTAPDLFAGEVANGLWKYVEHGDITAEEATERLAMALALAGQPLVPGIVLAHEALSAAVTYHHPVYDMMYAVLARRQGAAVLTLDARLARALSTMKVQADTPDTW